MNERDFINDLIKELDLHLKSCEVDHHKPVLYDLTVDDDGVIRKSVTDSGEAKRGGGKGFEQDILICEAAHAKGADKPNADRVQVPRVIAEVKFKNVTTHDAIIYSEKARRIRTVYPYLRYGLILGGFPTIPGRVFRLGQGLDFIFAISHPFIANQITSLRKAFEDEVKVSRDLAKIAFGKEKITSFRREIRYNAKAT